MRILCGVDVRPRSAIGRISARSWRKIGTLAGGLAVGLALFFLIGGSRPLTPARIQHDVLAMGGLGLVGFLAASAARPLLVVVSGSLFSVAAGLVWGMWTGAVVALGGTLLAALLVFALARRLGASAVRELAGARYPDLETLARDKGFAFVFVATLGFVLPSDLVIAVAAVTGMRMHTVLAAAALGTLPGTLLMTAIGASVIEPSPLLWWLGGAAVVLLTVVAALLARGWLPRRERRTAA
ncbi:MAG TPA: VTT domain-containing protein [Vulgatibacter sp.]|nr:VTT domain-containing protein [Vulgatibacter sp.]